MFWLPVLAAGCDVISDHCIPCLLNGKGLYIAAGLHSSLAQRVTTMLHKPAHLQRVGVAVCILSCKYVQVSVRHSVALFLLAPDLSCEVLQHWYCLCKFFFGKIAFLVNMLLLNLLNVYLTGIIVVYTPLPLLQH